MGFKRYYVIAWEEMGFGLLFDEGVELVGKLAEEEVGEDGRRVEEVGDGRLAGEEGGKLAEGEEDGTLAGVGRPVEEEGDTLVEEPPSQGQVPYTELHTFLFNYFLPSKKLLNLRPCHNKGIQLKNSIFLQKLPFDFKIK